MSSFDIMTDTPTELAASEASNRQAQAVKLASELASCQEGETLEEEMEKARQLAMLL